jgi:hypothetical protein
MLLIGIGWSALALFDLWFILLRPDVPWRSRISFLLGLIGVYTFAFGVLNGSGVLDWSPRLGHDLTSPNPTRLLAGLMSVCGVAFNAFSLALEPKRTSESWERRGASALYLLQTPIVLAVVILLVPFALVYILVVAPLAWIAYAIVSAPLDSLLASGRDIEIVLSEEGKPDSTMRIKTLVDTHLVAIRNSLVAVPALVSSLVLAAPSLI